MSSATVAKVDVHHGKLPFVRNRGRLIDGEIDENIPGYNPKNILVVDGKLRVYVEGLQKLSHRQVNYMICGYRKRFGMARSREDMHYPINSEIDINAPGFNPEDLVVLGYDTVMYVEGFSEKSVTAQRTLKEYYRRKYHLMQNDRDANHRLALLKLLRERSVSGDGEAKDAEKVAVPKEVEAEMPLKWKSFVDFVRSAVLLGFTDYRILEEVLGNDGLHKHVLVLAGIYTEDDDRLRPVLMKEIRRVRKAVEQDKKITQR